jgi:hypothetical protein
VQARQDLDELRGVRTEWTPRQVRTAVREADRELTQVVDLLDAGASGRTLRPGLLGESGPRSLLVALGNNAELRGTGGYVSTFATGRVEAGRLDLRPFQDVDSVRDEPASARVVPAPPEYVEDYGPFRADTTLFREWTMSPDVPDAASVGAAAAGALLGQAPDIVLLLDVPRLTGIVGWLAPDVTLPDGSTVPDGPADRGAARGHLRGSRYGPAAQDAARAALRPRRAARRARC